MQLNMSGPVQSGELLNSRKRSSFIKPTFPNKLPRVERVMEGVEPMGLPQATTLSSTFQKVPIKYAEYPFSYSLNGKGGTDLPPPRRSSKSGLSQIIQPFHIERQLSNGTFYRPNKMASPVGDFQTYVTQEHSAIPFKPYKRNLEKSLPRAVGIHTPIALRKLTGGAISPQSRNPVVIPKPVYGHRACCPKSGYTSALSYSIDHAFPRRINQSVSNENWKGQYGSMALLQREAHERLIGEHNYQVEQNGVRLPVKGANPELQFPIESAEHVRFPTLLQPKFPATNLHPSHPLLNYSSTQFSNLQPPPNVNCDRLPSLSSSSDVAQKVTHSHFGISYKMYQDNHAMLMYTEENVGSRNTSAFKELKRKCTGENPSNVNKSSCRKPIWQHEDLQTMKDISVPTAPGSHPFLQSFKQPPSGIYKMHSSGGFFSEESVSHLHGWRSGWPVDVQKAQDRSPPDHLYQLHSPCPIHSLQSHSDSGCVWNPAQANCKVPENGRCDDNLSSEEPSLHPTSVHHHKKTDHIVEKLEYAESAPSLSTEVSDSNNQKSSDSVKSVANKLSFLEYSADSDCVCVVKTPKQDRQKKVLTPKQKYDLQQSLSPPMPIINNVFSLAPYKSYLESLEKLQKVKAKETFTTCSIQKQENKSEGVHQCLKETEIKKDDANVGPVSSHSAIAFNLENNKHGIVMHERQIYTKDCVRNSFSRPGIAENKFLQHIPNEHSVLMLSLSSKSPLSHSETNFFFQPVLPQCLKVPAFKGALPDVFKANENKVQLSTTDSKNGPKQTLDHFMKLHLSLCKRISTSASFTKEQELITWLAKRETNKTQGIFSLLGSSAREIWLKCQDTAAALRQVLCQLENYISCHQCPFPHVIRAGTIFIPMLVIKEVLFFDVPGELIDQVLQEHHVELRPTTLSEERHLMQLQKRACSSKQRRLLSLKQLPDIYPDILNLFYFTCVKERLGKISLG
ncbi:hypothetical protein GN956_G10548 [Arapaima gigas]